MTILLSRVIKKNHAVLRQAVENYCKSFEAGFKMAKIYNRPVRKCFILIKLSKKFLRSFEAELKMAKI